jgi:general stress protein 26
LLSIGTITILDEIVSLSSVGVSKIRINGKFKPQQRILDQSKVEVVASTTEATKFNVKPKMSLKDKVYLETYYHHSQVDIEVDETLDKI